MAPLPASYGLCVCSFIVCLLIILDHAEAAELDHRYQRAETVPVWASYMVPAADPTGRQRMLDMPYCRPSEQVARPFQNVADALYGFAPTSWGLRLGFKINISRITMCHVSVFRNDQLKLLQGIRDEYIFQLIVDGLPVHGRVGVASREQHEKWQNVQRYGDVKANDTRISAYILTHFDFQLLYNADQIVACGLTQGGPVRYDTGDVPFTYSVTWRESDIPFARRDAVALSHLHSVMHHKYGSLVHYFSLINGSLIVIILLLTLVAILSRSRIVANDADHMEKSDVTSDPMSDIEETGWRQIHADVWRPPDRSRMLAVLCGAGFQIMGAAFTVCLSGMFRGPSLTPGLLGTTVLKLYCVMAAVGGFETAHVLTRYEQAGTYSRSHSKQHRPSHRMRGRDLVVCVASHAAGFPALCFATALIAGGLYPGEALSADALWQVFAELWLQVCVPLSALGFILGRAFHVSRASYLYVNPIPRPIPKRPPLLSGAALAACGGTLPFGALIVDAHYSFAALWSHEQHFAAYGSLFATFWLVGCIAALSGACVTYALLVRQDYRWAYPSFYTGAFTGAYCFLYAVAAAVSMPPWADHTYTAYYLTLVAATCISIGAACGSAAYAGATAFVHMLYKDVAKFD